MNRMQKNIFDLISLTLKSVAKGQCYQGIPCNITVFLIQDHAYSEFIGSVEINTVELLQGSEKDGWFPIKKKSNGKIKGQLNIRVLFISRQQMEKVCFQA